MSAHRDDGAHTQAPEHLPQTVPRHDRHRGDLGRRSLGLDHLRVLLVLVVHVLDLYLVKDAQRGGMVQHLAGVERMNVYVNQVLVTDHDQALSLIGQAFLDLVRIQSLMSLQDELRAVSKGFFLLGHQLRKLGDQRDDTLDHMRAAILHLSVSPFRCSRAPSNRT
jgi:hypothetical protein